jgi:hypothetical protein
MKLTVTDILSTDPKLINQDFMSTTLLTPRSAEAFRMSGVLPEALLYPAMELNVDSAVAQIRFNAALECRDYFAKALAKDYAKLV